jgi:hypothetical protein
LNPKYSLVLVRDPFNNVGLKYLEIFTDTETKETDLTEITKMASISRITVQNRVMTGGYSLKYG